MKIYLSPSGQAYNKYAYGGVTEADECDLIGHYCEVALKRSGIEAKCAPKSQRTETNVKASNAWGADYHICIHTNAISGDNSKPSAEGCVIFTAKANVNSTMPHTILDELQTLKGKNSIYGVRAHSGLYEINATNAKCIYIEVEFHDNVELAKWIINNVKQIGEAIAKGVCKALAVEYKSENAAEGSNDPEFVKYKQLAVDAGIVKGYGNGVYGWTDNMTREQFIVILGRLGLLNG